MPRRPQKLREVFQRRLMEARTKAGISQRNLGLKAGMHADSASPRVNRYELGVYEPDLETLQRLAIALEVPAAYLLAIDDDVARVIMLLSQQSASKRAALVRMLKDAVADEED